MWENNIGVIIGSQYYPGKQFVPMKNIGFFAYFIKCMPES